MTGKLPLAGDGHDAAAMGMSDPLAQLRGYHLPEPISWWPPAPGWWLLALLIVAGVMLLTLWLTRRHRRGAAARAAEAELVVLRANLARDGDGTAFVRGLSRLLRRFALVHYSRRAVAGLSGEAWLAFLDATGGAGRFLAGPGRLLLEAPYRPLQQDLPLEELDRLVLDWIRINRHSGGQEP